MTEQVNSSVLDTGLRVVTEAVPGARSAAVGVWVLQGAAHESPEVLGESHLLEHMVFKGTARRSGPEIAASLERLGGSLDAYTSREHTSFQARVLGEHLDVAVDVLGDLVCAPLLRAGDLELERGVVLEEIAQVEDTPDDLVFELHNEHLWAGHPYGHTILGTAESVARISATRLGELQRERYGGGNLLLVAAGQVEHEHVVRLAATHLGRTGAAPIHGAVAAPVSPRVGRIAIPRDSAQSHLVMGGVTVPHSDSRRRSLAALSQAFGGGMSSRLFQRVREDLGLAYSVFSFQSFYGVAGMAGVYVGSRVGAVERVVEVLRSEYSRLATEGLSRDELDTVRQQVKGQMLLSLESTGARMHRLATFALHGEPYEPVERSLEHWDALTTSGVAEAAEAFYQADRQLVLSLGPAG